MGPLQGGVGERIINVHNSSGAGLPPNSTGSRPPRSVRAPAVPSILMAVPPPVAPAFTTRREVSKRSGGVSAA
jgi:hypothetical protein